MCLAYRSVTNEELPNNLVTSHKQFYTFEDFCVLLAEFKYRVRLVTSQLLV